MQNQKNAQQLIVAHLEWRKKLLEFAYSGKHCEWADSARSGDASMCELGKILSKMDMKSNPLLQAIFKTHEQFHIEAKEIFDLAIAGNTQEVERILGLSTSSFIETTFKLVSLLRQLEKNEN